MDVRFLAWGIPVSYILYGLRLRCGSLVLWDNGGVLLLDPLLRCLVSPSRGWLALFLRRGGVPLWVLLSLFPCGGRWGPAAGAALLPGVDLMFQSRTCIPFSPSS